MTSEFLDKNNSVKDVIIDYTEIGKNARGESYIEKCKKGEHEHTVSYKEYGSRLGCSNNLCSRGWIDIGLDVHLAINGDQDVIDGSVSCTAPERGKHRHRIHKTCGNKIYFRLTLKK